MAACRGIDAGKFFATIVFVYFCERLVAGNLAQAHSAGAQLNQILTLLEKNLLEREIPL